MKRNSNQKRLDIRAFIRHNNTRKNFLRRFFMFYITGIHALNIPCSLKTEGDWHASALQWKNIQFYSSEKMFFKDYGIEANKEIPESAERYFVANHIRALLDLLELGKYSIAQGMNREYICNEDYDK